MVGATPEGCDVAADAWLGPLHETMSAPADGESEAMAQMRDMLIKQQNELEALKAAQK